MFTVTPCIWQSPEGHDQYYKEVKYVSSAKIERGNTKLIYGWYNHLLGKSNRINRLLEPTRMFSKVAVYKINLPKINH